MPEKKSTSTISAFYFPSFVVGVPPSVGVTPMCGSSHSLLVPLCKGGTITPLYTLPLHEKSLIVQTCNCAYNCLLNLFLSAGN